MAIPFSSDLRKVFDGKKEAKLGTEKNPVKVTVKTEKKYEKIEATLIKHGWHYSIELDPKAKEDVADLDRLLHPPEPQKAEEKMGRNDPCSCGSGKKFKNCCGK